MAKIAKENAPDPNDLGPSESDGKKPAVVQKAKRIEGETMSETASTQSTSINPSVKVFGCGGCGANFITRCIDSLSPEVDCCILDTSKSNLSNPNIKHHVIEGDGSGKIRASNVDAINKFISSKMFIDDEPADINVVIFSASGGTGSVFAPLLIKELKRRDKAIVVMIVSETSSQLDTENTANTLKTLQNISAQDGVYLPMMLFDNNFGISNVNTTLKHRLVVLTTFLTKDIFGMDKSDKINWLRPDKTIGVPATVTGFHMSVGEAGDFRSESGEVCDRPADFLYDSIIFAAKTDNAKPSTEQRILYSGVLRDPKDEEVVGIIGFPVANEYLSKLNALLSKYQSQGSVTQDLGIDSKRGGSQHGSGLIL